MADTPFETCLQKNPGLFNISAFTANSMVPEVIHITCNMGSRDLPDMYALSPQACGLWALGIHIRQIPPAHVTYNLCIHPVLTLIFPLIGVEGSFDADFLYQWIA